VQFALQRRFSFCTLSCSEYGHRFIGPSVLASTNLRILYTCACMQRTSCFDVLTEVPRLGRTLLMSLFSTNQGGRMFSIARSTQVVFSFELVFQRRSLVPHSDSGEGAISFLLTSEDCHQTPMDPGVSSIGIYSETSLLCRRGSRYGLFSLAFHSHATERFAACNSDSWKNKLCQGLWLLFRFSSRFG
jgi:hypothetical protein